MSCTWRSQTSKFCPKQNRLLDQTEIQRTLASVRCAFHESVPSKAVSTGSGHPDRRYARFPIVRRAVPESSEGGLVGGQFTDQARQPVRDLIERHLAHHAHQPAQILPKVGEDFEGEIRMRPDKRAQNLVFNHAHLRLLERFDVDRVRPSVEGRHLVAGLHFLEHANNLLPSLRRDPVELDASLFDDVQAGTEVAFPK